MLLVLISLWQSVADHVIPHLGAKGTMATCGDHHVLSTVVAGVGHWRRLAAGVEITIEDDQLDNAPRSDYGYIAYLKHSI